MTTTPNPAAPGSPRRPSPTGESSPWAAGGAMFAAVMMMVIGVFGILEGIAALANDDVIFRVRGYTFKFDLTGWGWIHIVIGILLLVTGLAILKGTTWGRAVGIALTAIAAIFHFLWLPYQPFWSIVAIAICVFVIWALCVDRSGSVFD